MKNIFKSVLVGTMSAVALTGCIEEILPTSDVSQDQLDSSNKAGEALIWAMPSYLVQWNSLGRPQDDEWHGDCGYASLMHIRDFMTGDMCLTGPMLGYDQYYWFSLAAIDDRMAYTQFVWQYHYKMIQTANKACESFSEDSEDAVAKGYRATALAFRAMAYLDASRWCEFLENDKTSPVNSDGNNVLGLTVPIVTEKTTEEEARNNPRVSREKMVEFILSDLDYAEQNISGSNLSSPLLPNLSCVYGLKARLYMWIENYPKAAEYAKMAMAGYAPLDEEQWTNVKTGFNSPDNKSWMWAMQYVKENETVQTGICNWLSFMSLEAYYGYAGAGCAPAVDASMYERIPDSDFRKLSWVPADFDSPLYDKVSLVVPEDIDYNIYYMPLGTVKFRPGEGNYEDSNVGSAVWVPMMRYEEMAFIAMEADAHQSAAQGKNDLVEFMTNYRDSEYACDASSVEDVVEEIVFQKRVELWGEGQALWDIKRLNYSVTRSYEGSNWEAEKAFNTQGRPAWVNMIMVRSEPNNNDGVRAWQNAPFAGVYSAIPIPGGEEGDDEPQGVVSRAADGNGPMIPLRKPNPRLQKYRPMWINE